MSERMTGTVKWFNASKGYGYIESGMDEDIFVYYDSIIDNRFKHLIAGDQVEFALNRKPSGPIAVEVKRV